MWSVEVSNGKDMTIGYRETTGTKIEKLPKIPIEYGPLLESTVESEK